MDVLYPVLVAAADEDSAVVRQAAGSALLRFSAHSGLYTHTTSTQGSGRAGGGGGGGGSSGGAAGSGDGRLAALLGSNLDYAVDPLLADLRAEHAGPMWDAPPLLLRQQLLGSQGEGLGRHAAGGVPKAVGVLRSLVALSSTAASAPLMRDVLGLVVAEVDAAASRAPFVPTGQVSARAIAVGDVCHRRREASPLRRHQRGSRV